MNNKLYEAKGETNARKIVDYIMTNIPDEYVDVEDDVVFNSEDGPVLHIIIGDKRLGYNEFIFFKNYNEWQCEDVYNGPFLSDSEFTFDDLDIQAGILGEDLKLKDIYKQLQQTASLLEFKKLAFQYYCKIYG